MPALAERAHTAFWLIDATRWSNGYSANAISLQDIRYYRELFNVPLKPWECRAILEMDRVRVQFLNRDPDDSLPVDELPVLKPGGLAAQFNKE